MTTRDQQLAGIDDRLKLIENDVRAITEQINFLIEGGPSRSELKFPGFQSSLIKFEKGNRLIATRIRRVQEQWAA